ncbi:MAG: putative transcriptional regulator [Bacteroidetes bacterium]|nr:MAG: putative transcriptional regulator [Bacteroidota bacterium]
MSKKENIKPTESELEILQVLWENGPSTVRFINDKLNEQKETGYTTTLKIMQIMTEKKLLKREEDGRSHIYKAAIRRDDTQKQMLDRILETAYGGDAAALVLQALGHSKTTKEELEQIKAFIKQMEGGKK